MARIMMPLRVENKYVSNVDTIAEDYSYNIERSEDTPEGLA